MDKLKKYKGVIGQVICMHDHGCDMQFSLGLEGELKNFNPDSKAHITFYVPRNEIK